MTSQVNLEDIYTELNNLLKDVCSFLTAETQNGTLSAKAKNEAEKLVSRSRKQVDIVTNLSVVQESLSSNYPYLKMLPGPIEESLTEYVPPETTDYNEPEDHYEESYAPVDDFISRPVSTPNEDYCCYSDLAICMIEERSVKYGPLCRKERYIFIEQKKQYMAALVGFWLLIYAINKRDQKPIQTINVLNYSARSIENRKDPTFEIYAENEKSHEFIARSMKDMEQWVVAINCKKHVSTNGRNLPDIPTTTPQESIDHSDKNSNKIISDLHNYEAEDEEIYASVDDFSKLDLPKIIPTTTSEKEDFPSLPPRSKETITSPVSSQSFGDNTYNNFKETDTIENNEDDSNSEYDFVQCIDVNKVKSANITETINLNVTQPRESIDNYDCVDTGEELLDKDTLKSVKSKIPVKIEEDEEEEMVDYTELKPITQINKYNQNCPEDEVLEDYDVVKPVSQNKAMHTFLSGTLVTNSSFQSQNDEQIGAFVLQKQPEVTPEQEGDDDDDDLEEYAELKPIPDKNQTKTKPVKSMNKFWEKKSDSPNKKEFDEDDSGKKLKGKLPTNTTPEKNKPPITSPKPKPKPQTMKNEFSSSPKNRNSKDDDGNSKVQKIRQKLEYSLSFRSSKN